MELGRDLYKSGSVRDKLKFDIEIGKRGYGEEI